jgi:molybdenum cofactor cytidylyltransferase
VKFARFSLGELEGALLGHSIRTEGISFKKGRILSEHDISDLRAAGIEKVVAAVLEPGDVSEDIAATTVTEAAMGAGVSSRAAFTGRCNVYADVAGIVVVDRQRVDNINLFDESLTIATLDPYETVVPRQMVATVKVIPFSAPERTVEAAAREAGSPEPLIKVAPFRPKRISLIMTRLTGTKDSVLASTVNTVSNRIESLGSRLVTQGTVHHEETEVAKAITTSIEQGCEIILISGASAIVDRRDVIPLAIEIAGGKVDHFGMPVDPGNLLLLGHIETTSDTALVLGLPGCARSPKLNGFDWVLERLVADQDVTARDIMKMGAGGLLKEIPSRPQPRHDASRPASGVKSIPVVGGILLAAGQSRRMGKVNKLLAEIDGVPMIRYVASALRDSGVGPLVIVTGHQAEKICSTLKGFDAEFVHNPRYGEGLSTSLQVGVSALANRTDGVIICQGDMPEVSSRHIDRLLAAFDPTEGREICVPTGNGKRGNPVLWAARYFPEILSVAGDVGARHLIGEHAESVCEVEMEDIGVLVDIDTPQALRTARSKIQK